MENKYEIIFNYLKLESQNPLGCGKYAPLILMINEDYKIINELLEESDFELKGNLLSFLDYSLRELMRKEKIDSFNTALVITRIMSILYIWNNTENKWEISGEEFVKILLEKRGYKNE